MARLLMTTADKSVAGQLSRDHTSTDKGETHMRKPHITFVSFPHFAHVNPTIPVVSVLVKRGYRVTYITSTRFLSAIAATGAELVECAGFSPETLQSNSSPKSSDWSESEYRQDPVFGLVPSSLNALSAIYEERRPDLLVYDFMAYAGRIHATLTKTPAIQSSPTFAHHDSMFNADSASQKWRKATIDVAPIIAKFLRLYDVGAGASPFHKEPLNIHYFPREFQPHQEHFGSHYFFAGRCAGEQARIGGVKLKSPEGRPSAFVSTSTTFPQGLDYMKMCIQSLREAGWHVIVLARRSGDAESISQFDPEVEIVRDVPHTEILPHSDLIVCQGGIVAQAEAMYHGVPVIITSHGNVEFEMQATVMERLGIAVHIRKEETSADAIKRAAERVLTDSKFKSRVREMQQIVQSAPGAEETANRIQQYIESSRSQNP